MTAMTASKTELAANRRDIRPGRIIAWTLLFVGGLIMASAGAIHGGPTLSRFGKGGVILIAIFMALQELGVATDIVTTAFAILFGAIALSASLAFGLGNRDLAGEVTRNWYNRYKAERESIDRENAAQDAADRTDEFESESGGF